MGVSAEVEQLGRAALDATARTAPELLPDVHRRLGGPLPPDDRATLRATRALLLARTGDRAQADVAAVIARRTLGVTSASEHLVAALLAATADEAPPPPPPSPAAPSASPAPPSPAGLVRVELAGDRVRVADGPWIDLARRGPTRRILHALADARRADGRALDVYALFAAGWPGENPDPEAQSNRVYVVLHALRGLGLRAALKTSDEGYRLLAHIVGG